MPVLSVFIKILWERVGALEQYLFEYVIVLLRILALYILFCYR
jgi:hypothetical protein